MSASKLVKPGIEYKDSFLEALDEFHDEGCYTHLDHEDLENDFQGFVDKINTGELILHEPLPDWAELVPETNLWMVKEDQFIGIFRVRHRLNWHLEKWGGHITFMIRPSMRGKGFGKKMLQKGMPFVCYLGIERALLTIDPENDAAVRIVEFCGARLEAETTPTKQFPARRRYWLDCS